MRKVILSMWLASAAGQVLAAPPESEFVQTLTTAITNLCPSAQIETDRLAFAAKYEGAACVPQTIQGPYFPTFVDAPATDGGRKHYQVSFSYGARLDPALKKAILEAIPRTRRDTQGETRN